MQGWAEDVAGMAYALRSLPEGLLPATGESQLWGACPHEGKGGGGPAGGWGLCPPSVVPRRTLPQNQNLVL